MPGETQEPFPTKKCTVRSFDSPPNAEDPFNPLWNLRTSEGECALFPNGAVCELTMDQEIEIRADWKYLLHFDGESKGEEVRLVGGATCLILGNERYIYRLSPDVK